MNIYEQIFNEFFLLNGLIFYLSIRSVKYYRWNWIDIKIDRLDGFMNIHPFHHPYHGTEFEWYALRMLIRAKASLFNF